MPLQLPNEDAWIRTHAGEEFFVPADWLGEHGIVSECGWWIGKVSIVQVDGARCIDWFQVYSINFDEEVET